MRAQQTNNVRRHRCVPAPLVEHEAAYADIPAFMKVRDTYEQKITDVARLGKDRDTAAELTVEDENALRIILRYETAWDDKISPTNHIVSVGFDPLKITEKTRLFRKPRS